MAEFCRKTGEDCYGVRELKLLFEISTLLNKVKRDLKSNLDPVIELLANYLTAEKVMLTILNRANQTGLPCFIFRLRSRGYSLTRSDGRQDSLRRRDPLFHHIEIKALVGCVQIVLGQK